MKRLALFLLIASIAWSQAYQHPVAGAAYNQPSLGSKTNRLPLVLSGGGKLVGYWDAHSLIGDGVVDTGNVTTWHDNSPYANTVTQGAGSVTTPTLQIAASQYKYTPTVQFVTNNNALASASQFLTVPYNSSLVLTCPYTVFVVADHFVAPYTFAGRYVWQVGADVGPNGRMELAQTSGNPVPDTASVWDSPGRHVPRLHTFECGTGAASESASTGSKYSVNGAPKKLAASGASPSVDTTHAFTIGGGYSTGSFGSYSIDAIAIYSGVITPAERRLISQFLSKEYSIAFVDYNYDADRACGDAPDTHTVCTDATTFDTLPTRYLSRTLTYQGGSTPGNGTAAVGADASSATQPDIVDTGSNNFGGHRWWMTWTADFYGSVGDEQTDIAYSDNAEATTPTWSEPLGISSHSVNPPTFGWCQSNAQTAVSTMAPNATPGTGYVVGDFLTITSGGGSGAVAMVTAVNGSGSPTLLAVKAGGTGYATTAGTTTSGGTGSGAKVNIAIGCRGQTTSSVNYNVTDPEIAYNDSTFCDASGSPCGNGGMYLFDTEQSENTLSAGNPLAQAMQVIWSSAADGGTKWRGVDNVNSASPTNLPAILTFGGSPGPVATSPSQQVYISASVTWDDNIHLWVLYYQAGASGSTTFWRATATMAGFPTTWSVAKQVTLDTGTFWHSKVKWDKGYYYLFYVPTSSPVFAGFATSSDGLTFEVANLSMLNRTTYWSDAWLYKGGMYRRSDGNWEIYHGGTHTCANACSGADCDVPAIVCGTTTSTYTGGVVSVGASLWRVGHFTLTWPGQ